MLHTAVIPNLPTKSNKTNHNFNNTSKYVHKLYKSISFIHKQTFFVGEIHNIKPLKRIKLRKEKSPTPVTVELVNSPTR